MKKLIGIAALAMAALALVAGDLLAGQSGAQAGGDPLQTQLRDRTCTQTCDPAQDCDGNQIQYRPRTRQNWPGEDEWLPLDEAELEFLLWLWGLE